MESVCSLAWTVVDQWTETHINVTFVYQLTTPDQTIENQKEDGDFIKASSSTNGWTWCASKHGRPPGAFWGSASWPSQDITRACLNLQTRCLSKRGDISSSAQRLIRSEELPSQVISLNCAIFPHDPILASFHWNRGESKCWVSL